MPQISLDEEMKKMMSTEFRGRKTSRRNSPTSDEYEGRQQGQNKPYKERETCLH